MSSLSGRPPLPHLRTVHEAIGAVETYSPAEERFNRRRRTVGLIAAPLVLASVLFLPTPGLTPAAHHLAAIMLTVIVLWVTEALPMAVTAILGPTLAVVLQVAPARVALAPFADPIIFLFIGSFILAEAMFVHGVDRRIAFTAPGLADGRHQRAPHRHRLRRSGNLCLDVDQQHRDDGDALSNRSVDRGARLSIGTRGTRRRGRPPVRDCDDAHHGVRGVDWRHGTPVGTPPNLIGLGFIERVTGRHVGFLGWMQIGVPLVAVLFSLLAWWLSRTVRGLQIGAGGAALVREELQRLGPVSTGQRNTLLAFGATVLLWTAPGMAAIVGAADAPLVRAYERAVPESVAAMLGAILLFVLPLDWRKRQFTLTWNQAVRIDWGIVLLYGGGLALGELAFSTGLARWIGDSLTAWLPVRTELALTIVFAGLAILLSETTSNTASANMIVPVAIAVAQAAGVNPLQPALAATLGASMGFMMPISTAPNAIVYSSGHVPITAMMRHGLLLDLAGFVLIVAAVFSLVPLLL